MVFKGIKLCLREEEEEELGEEGVGEEELTAQTKTNRENLQTGEAAFSNMIFFFFLYYMNLYYCIVMTLTKKQYLNLNDFSVYWKWMGAAKL